MSATRIHLQRSTSRTATLRAFFPVVMMCGAMLTLFVIALGKQLLEDRSPRSDVPMITVRQGQDIRLRAEEVSDGGVHLFEIAGGGQRARFLVQRVGSVVHVGAASCRACARSGTSHYSRKGEFFCGQCKHAMRFETVPAPNSDERCTMPEIRHSYSGGFILIQAADVKAVFDKNFR